MFAVRCCAALLSLLLFVPGCRPSKLLETAKANATQYGLARCECERPETRDVPKDQTLCTEQMQQAKRYLTFNFEMGKFSETEKAEVLAHGDKIYRDCLARQAHQR